MFKLVKTLCSKICKNYFENSEESCLSAVTFQDRLYLMLKPSTLLDVKITRQIQNFCQINQNRFWNLYYRISESKIYFSCNRCNKNDLCREYILDRIIRYIKRFDITQESKVFKQVRANLISSEREFALDRESKEIVTHYTKKITKEYREKSFDFDTGEALISNVILQMKNSEIQYLVEKRIRKYRVYKSPIVLKDLIDESLADDKAIVKPTLIELLHKEKFKTYIRQSIDSRFKDFVKSKSYINEIIEEIEPTKIADGNRVDIETLLNGLSNEQKIIYKLKNAIRLDNREFLNISYRLNYLDSSLPDSLTPDEKLYIKFSVHYEIADNSSHFSMIDVSKVKESISQKISDYRGKLQSHSYIEKQEEIFIKLIYSEPLSAKEMGVVFNLSSKQINKKVENIKKRLQKLEQKL